MLLKVKSHDPHLSSDRKPIIEFELPDKGWDKDAVLWAIAYHEVQDTLQHRFRNYGSALYRHVRDGVSVVISGGFIKMVLKDLREKGIIRYDDHGQIVWIDPDWRSVIR